VAVDDEARARAVLVEMQARISLGPHAALGLDDATMTPEAVRASFLALTKKFHPARFGRMSTELQRLSNEVFLGIKAAHEQLLRGLGVAPRGTWSGNQSGAMPIVSAEGTNRTARPGTPQPRAAGTAQPVRAGSPAIPRTLTPTRHGVGVPGSVTPPFGVRVGTSPRPGTPPGTPPGNVPPATPPAPGRGGTLPLARAGTPPATRPGTPPATRPGTPPVSTTPAPARPTTPSAPNGRPSTPNLTPPTSPPPDAQTNRGTGSWQPKTTPAFDERSELQQVMDALAQKNWGAAKALLNGLAARVQSSSKYRALIAYTRGREAQSAGRGEDAVMEFQRALQIDPELQQAKSALGELLRRR
jgi:hypothetical protein